MLCRPDYFSRGETGGAAGKLRPLRCMKQARYSGINLGISAWPPAATPTLPPPSDAILT